MNSVHSSMTDARYSSIDDLLGDRQTRFFGAGYRRIRRRVTAVRLSTRESAIEASAEIEYPSAWSTKTSRELQPHLSSIDALSIASQLAEAYLRVVYGLEGRAADELKIARSVLKPGPTPTTDLANVAARCVFADALGVDAVSGRQRSLFNARVGTMAVELLIEHAAATPREATGTWNDVAEVLGPLDCNYYASAHTIPVSTLTDITFDESGERVSATLDLEVPNEKRILTGMGAAHYPSVSEITTIVTVAQLAQALFYRYDDVRREQSNNFWLRKLVLVSHEPVAAARGLHLETWSTKLSLLPLKDGIWRTGNFELAYPGITGEYTVAHMLPATVTGRSEASARHGRAITQQSITDRNGQERQP